MTKTSRRRVARIGEKRVARPCARLVHFLETIEGEIDLASNLHPAAWRALIETQRDVAHSPQIDGDVFADDSIPARCAHHEEPILVGKGDCGPVDLQLRGVARLPHVVTGDAKETLLPGAKLLVVESIREREHWADVGVLGELALWLGADSERRRIRRAALGENLFDLLQLSEEPVVLGVRERGPIEYVVFVGSARENYAQLESAATLLLCGLLRRLRKRLIGVGRPGCFLDLFL